MAVRQEDLSEHALARQAGFDRSWSHGQKMLTDPQLRAYLEQSILRVNASTSRTTLTHDEFLALTETDAE